MFVQTMMWFKWRTAFGITTICILFLTTFNHINFSNGRITISSPNQQNIQRWNLSTMNLTLQSHNILTKLLLMDTVTWDKPVSLKLLRILLKICFTYLITIGFPRCKSNYGKLRVVIIFQNQMSDNFLKEINSESWLK